MQITRRPEADRHGRRSARRRWTIPARSAIPSAGSGKIICGRCGQRMTVRYHLRHGAELPDYLCQKSKIEHAGQMCQQIPGAGLDNAIGQLLIDTLMGAVGSHRAGHQSGAGDSVPVAAGG